MFKNRIENNKKKRIGKFKNSNFYCAKYNSVIYAAAAAASGVYV